MSHSSRVAAYWTTDDVARYMESSTREQILQNMASISNTENTFHYTPKWRRIKTNLWYYPQNITTEN